MRRPMRLSVAVLTALAASLLVPAGAAAAGGGSLSGTVRADDGRTRVTGLCVAALDATTGQRAAVSSVAADGSYVLDALSPGQYVVEFDCGDGSSLAGEFYDDAPTRSGARRIQVDAGAAVAGIDAVLTSTGVLAGAVTAEDGEPLAGVCVTAATPGHTGYAVSDELGRWRTDGLHPGSYSVYLFPCEGETRAWLPEYYGGAGRESEAARVEVAAGQVVEGLDEALVRGSVVTARAVDATTGAALAGCSGDAKDAFFHGDHHVDPADGDGRFRVLGVPGGEWWFWLRGCADEWYPRSWYEGREVYLEGGTSGPAPLVLRNGTDAAIDVAVDAGGRISGRVVDPRSTTSPQGCTVRFLDESGRSRGATGLTDGAYRSDALPVGRYVVQVYGCVGDYAARYHPDSLDSATATWVTVAARTETAGVDVELVDGSEQAVRSIEPACPPDRVPYAHFDDVQVGPHRPAVDCVAWWEVARGYGPEFRPDEVVSRGQMASFLARLIERSGGGLPQAPADAFDDDDGHTHERSINALAELGIVRGNAGRVLPDAPIDRAQMASFLERVLRHRIDAPLLVTRDHFSDDDGSVHERAINAVAEARVTGGRADGSYAPVEPVRRIQMASFLARSLALLVEGGHTAPPE